MTLIELQKKLGDEIDILTDPRTPAESRKKEADTAAIISSLAKQMINNADIILRTEKLVSEGKMKDSSIVRMISHES